MIAAPGCSDYVCVVSLAVSWVSARDGDPGLLNLSEALQIERCKDVDGIVVVTAHGRLKMVPGASGHALWVTAFDAGCLSGNEIEPILEASGPLKAAVGLSELAVLNQGPLDNSERSALVQTLSFLRRRQRSSAAGLAFPWPTPRSAEAIASSADRARPSAEATSKSSASIASRSSPTAAMCSAS